MNDLNHSKKSQNGSQNAWTNSEAGANITMVISFYGTSTYITDDGLRIF